MNKYLLTIISIVLFMSCQLKKKTSEINTVDQQTVLQNTKDVKTQTNLKIIHVDSSKIIKSNLDNLYYSKSSEIEFELIPNNEESTFVTAKNNSSIFDKLLNRSQRVKILFNHAQQKSNSQLLTQQNYIKSKTDSSVSKKETHKQAQKIDIKEKNELISESKTYTTLIWWTIAAGVLITIYFFNKFNIPALILGFFKL